MLKEKRNKTKIVLSLLVAMAFLLPATSAFVGTTNVNSIEEVDASDGQKSVKNVGEITPTDIEANLAESFDRVSNLLIPGSPRTLGIDECEVWIDSIAMLENMPVGCYDIEIEICKEALPGLPPCPDCEVKVFADIFKCDPIPSEEIYCTDFEDVADIYNNWDSVDDTTDSTSGPGGIDTWTWSDTRSHSASHSFRCTQFNGGYLGNQLDYLVTEFQNTEGYEEIDVTFWNWCQGEGVATGSGTVLEDYGYVEYSLDGGPWTDFGEVFWDNDWEETILTISGVSTVLDIGIRFVWTSGPTVQNEGWYVDDVCFDGRKSPYEYHVFQTHSIGPILVDDCCVTYTFPETWCPDEGEYIISIWMLIHGPEECTTLDPQGDPFIHNVEIGDVADIAVTANAYAGSSPFEMGEDLVVSATVENVGTVDATNVPVTLSVQLQIKTYVLDDYMEAGEGNWGWMFVAGGIAEQMFHITESKSYSPTHSWTNQDETTGNYVVMGNALVAEPIDPFEGDPISLDFTAMINYKIDIGASITPVFRASTYYWDYSVNWPTRDPPWVGPDSTPGWVEFSFDDAARDWPDLIWKDRYGWHDLTGFMDLLNRMNDHYGPDGLDVEDFSAIEIGFLFEAVAAGTSGDTGLFIDNARITKVTAGAEVHKEIIVIDELKAVTPSDPAETENLVYEWEDMPTGDYVEAVSVPPDDNIDNNEMALTFSVITDIAEVEDTDVESYDLTEGAESHWHITTSGYNNYLWCGEESTGTYGDDWNDVVLLAPAGSDPDPSLDMSGLTSFNLEFDEYCKGEGSPYDYGIVEINPSVSTPGNQWYSYSSAGTKVFGTESFEAGIVPPGGWTQIIYAGPGMWMPEMYPFDAPFMPPGLGMAYAEADSWPSTVFGMPVPFVPFDCGLFTPTIDMSTYPFYELDFNAVYANLGLTDTHDVRIYSTAGTVLEQTIDLSVLTGLPPGYYWDRPIWITLDPSGYNQKTDVQIEFWHDTKGFIDYFVYGVDDVEVFEMGIPEPGDGYYDWQHSSFTFSPSMFLNPYTGDTFENEIGSTFTGDMGFRFRWISDEAYHERGWILDNIEITGSEIFPEDSCDNMDNFLLDTITGGDWWSQTGPSQWTCQDQISGLIPNDINNALVWDIAVPQTYSAELQFTHTSILEDGEDYAFLEFSTNGGSSWVAPVAYTGNFGPVTTTIDMTSFIGGDVLIRWRVVTNEDTPSGIYIVEDMSITGQVDINPPVTTGTFSGTVLHGFYNTPVTMTLTASDDLSGVQNTYYSIDGGSQMTYSAPVSIGVNGDHTVEFYSVDNVNNEETPHHTASFKIDAGSAPTIAITAPTPGLYLFGSKLIDISSILIVGSFTIEATASDADSGVASVEFFIDGTSIGSDITSPYSMYCAVKHMGAGTIKATATDYADNEASATLDITYFKFL